MWKKSRQRSPIIYNPSAREKAALHLVVQAVTEDIAIVAFLCFDTKELFMLAVGFAFIRPHIFQAFQCHKDLKNLVKFDIEKDQCWIMC
jgi:hypothetical protein